MCTACVVGVFAPACQVITTFAGTGATTPVNSGVARLAANLNNPTTLMLDACRGRLYIGEQTGGRVVYVSLSTGIVYPYAGTGVPGFSGDGGLATSAQLRGANGMALGPDGSVYITEGWNPPSGLGGNNRVRRVYPNNTIVTFAGTGAASSTGDGGPPTAATLNVPRDVAFTPSGDLLIVERFGCRVRIVSAGVISAFAGTGVCGTGGDGGPATLARVDSPVSVAINSRGV